MLNSVNWWKFINISDQPTFVLINSDYTDNCLKTISKCKHIGHLYENNPVITKHPTLPWIIAVEGNLVMRAHLTMAMVILLSTLGQGMFQQYSYGRVRYGDNSLLYSHPQIYPDTDCLSQEIILAETSQREARRRKARNGICLIFLSTRGCYEGCWSPIWTPLTMLRTRSASWSSRIRCWLEWEDQSQSFLDLLKAAIWTYVGGNSGKETG